MNKENKVFSDRLNLLDAKLDKILELLTADKQPMQPEPEVYQPSLPELVLDYIGLHELHDKEKLMILFKKTGVLIDGKVLDPDETAWCAGFEYAICKLAGYDVPFALNARAFASIGEESDGQEGDIAVWGSHVATVMGKAKAGTGKITTAVEWQDAYHPDGDILMVGGGNQSNMVNISPKSWYDNYSEFIGFRRFV